MDIKRKIISKDIRDRVKLKFNGKCAYCGEVPNKLVIDHIFPVLMQNKYQGDINEESNLNPACSSCNNFKLSHTIEQFRNELSKQVERGLASSINFRLSKRYGLIKETNIKVEFYFEKVLN